MSAHLLVLHDAASGCAVLDSVCLFWEVPGLFVFQWKFHKILGLGKKG